MKNLGRIFLSVGRLQADLSQSRSGIDRLGLLIVHDVDFLSDFDDLSIAETIVHRIEVASEIIAALYHRQPQAEMAAELRARDIFGFRTHGADVTQGTILDPHG